MGAAVWLRSKGSGAVPDPWARQRHLALAAVRVRRHAHHRAPHVQQKAYQSASRAAPRVAVTHSIAASVLFRHRQTPLNYLTSAVPSGSRRRAPPLHPYRPLHTAVRHCPAYQGAQLGRRARGVSAPAQAAVPVNGLVFLEHHRQFESRAIGRASTCSGRPEHGSRLLVRALP